MYQLAKRHVQRGLRRVNAEVGRPLLNAPDGDASSLYQPLPEGYIRLLSIHTGEDGSPNWSLATYPLNLAPRYDAVSYSWGDDKTPRWIKVNGFMLQIRKTLSILLKASVHRTPPLRPLWIDQISLNQEDDLEKAVQVPLMGKVYEKASRTIVWLGESDENTFDTLVFMKSVMKYSESNEDMGSIGEDHLHPQEWKDVRRYLQRPWFERLWVLQEVLLSDNIEILCHAQKPAFARPIDVLSWNELVRFERMLVERGAYGNLIDEDKSVLEGSRIGCSIHFMELVRGLLQRGGGHLPMSALREYHQTRRCLEPIDRVWGLLGLLSPKLRAKVHEAGIIDYSPAGRREFWRSYLAFMKVLHDFDVTDFSHVITDDIGRKSNVNLPSWCIDFNAPKLYNAFPAFRRFRAGSTGPNDSTGIIESSIRPTDGALSVTGHLLDQVSRVTSVCEVPSFRSDDAAAADNAPSQESLEEVRMFVDWLVDCNELCDETLSGSYRAKKLAMCLTMVAADGEPKTLDFAKIAAKREKKTEASIIIYAHISVINSFEAILRGDAEPPVILHDEYLPVLSEACDNRKVFATQQGRIGLGPPDLKMGDRICAITGAEALFAIRGADRDSWVDVERRSTLVAAPRPGQETFRLVGDAYVHGLMFGEAFTAAGRGPTRQLVLI